MNEITRFTNEAPEFATLTRDGAERRIIRGLAAVYFDGSSGTEYHLFGNAYERIAPGAFSEALRSKEPVWLCRNHDLNARVAKTPKTLRVWETGKGLNYEGELNRSSSANDLWEDVTSGVTSGSSFRASVNLQDKTAAQWTREGSKDILTIKRFDSLTECSPVFQPAYQSTTSEAVMRSHKEFLLDEETQKRLTRIAELNTK